MGYDVSDADIEAFYAETTSGSGGDPPKGTIVAELIVKFFHGEFTPQGFKRYSGLWKGPPPGSIGKRALFVAKSSNVDEMFEKINWGLMDKRIDTTLGGPQIKQR